MSPSPFTAHTKQNAEFSSALAVCCRSGRGRATGGSAAGRTDGGLGGRVDDGEAAPERRLPPAPADEEAAARDRRLRGHDNAIDGPEPRSALLAAAATAAAALLGRTAASVGWSNGEATSTRGVGYWSWSMTPRRTTPLFDLDSGSAGRVTNQMWNNGQPHIPRTQSHPVPGSQLAVLRNF